MQTPNANDVIDHLAAKLSIPASHLWAVLVRQQKIAAAQTLIVIITALAFALIAWHAKARVDAWVKAGDAYSDRDVAGVFYLIARVLVPAISATVIATNLASLIGMLLNPEYYALAQILDAFKK